MEEKIIGAYHRDYMVKSKYGAQVFLKAKSKGEALLTGAELLNEDISDLSITHETDW